MRTMTRHFVLLGLLGLALGGCKKAMPSSSAPGMLESDRDYEMSAQPEEAYATSSAPSPMPPSPEPTRRALRQDKRTDDSPRDMAGGMPAPVLQSPAGPQSTPGTPAAAEPQQDLAGRMIIYSAGMRIAVFNLEEAMEKAESLPERFGGYVHSMDAGALVLKIPARKLRPAMAELAGYGVVEQRSLSTQDVSAEYVDIESRIRALESTHKQLIELLSKARTVDEALHVRQALDQVGAELEVMKGRMRQLDNLIAFSTLSLSLYERGPHTPTPSSNDPFPWVDSLGVEATEWK